MTELREALLTESTTHCVVIQSRRSEAEDDEGPQDALNQACAKRCLPMTERFA